MTSDHVVEALDVVEHICLGLIPGAVDLASRALSSATRRSYPWPALCHTWPDLFMLQTMPLSAISRWNCSLVYWLPRWE
jgi:hypothetical protein